MADHENSVPVSFGFIETTLYLHALSVAPGWCVFSRGNTQRQLVVSLLPEAGFLAKNQLLIGSITKLQHMRSEPCQPHGLTTVRWRHLTFCQLRFGGRRESSRIPIYETWPVSLMECQLWVQWWSHNKS